ncbi:MAG TPA: DUF3160 domain-containing protein [Polyangia bacterium]
MANIARWRDRFFAIGALSFLTTCSASDPTKVADPGGGQKPTVPGTPITATSSPAEQAERARITSALAGVAKLDAAGLRQAYPTQHAPLTYDPLKAAHLDLIDRSPLALTAAEKTILGKNGFVITDRHRFPAFPYGYETIYMADLPVFISADSILHAVHRSYDEMLKAIELDSLRADLDLMLSGMRGRLGAGAPAGISAEAARDTDVYLAVALSLLRGQLVAPVADGGAAEVKKWFDKAIAAGGAEGVKIFGATRMLDFSQFTPRGHYTDAPALENYFRAMIWLGRIDFRLLETQRDGSQLFHRRQLEGMLALTSLMEGEAREAWARVDGAIEAFVGESDNMRVPQVSQLLTALGVSSAAEVGALADATIVEALVAGGYGAQRISSHYMVNGMGKGTLPLSRTFLLLGQRYVLDSHVFSNVVYDRAGGGNVKRMLPDPLDVAFAALANNHAANLLEPELGKHAYAPDLAAMRVLGDEHDANFWGANLYNVWLSALRALSTGSADGGPLEVVRTEPWARRVLNTQLASWAELRHDTILYAKQSYTAGAVCEFPDALVEPNPAFFAALERFAERGSKLAGSLRFNQMGLGASVPGYFAQLGQVAGMLREMATFQKETKPFTATHMQFINEAVRIQRICGGGFVEGWYSKLFFNPAEAIKFAPTIADVHTQPTDEGGTPVGRILHVGTGYARLMVVTARTCQGPRAYVGLASSYFEQVTENWKRLDDPTWEKQIEKTQPADVRWMTDLVAR